MRESAAEEREKIDSEFMFERRDLEEREEHRRKEIESLENALR